MCMDTPMNEWKDAEGRVERAHRLFEDGRWPEAAAELQAAISINPYNAAWHYNLGLALEAMSDYERAGESLSAAAQLESEDIEILNALGVNMTRQGKYAESLEAFECIIAIDPNYEAAYCNRIITYTEMSQHDEAEVMFYMARMLEEDCPLCYYNIGNSFLARKEYARAIDCWEYALKIDPEHPQANARIADALWAQGDFEGAKKYFKNELELFGDEVDVLLDYGDLLLDLNEVDEAEKSFQHVLTLDPDNVSGIFSLADLAIKREQWSLAEKHLHTVLQLDPGYPCAHARLAQTLIRRGQIEEAAKHLLTEIRRAGDSSEMLNELAHLLLEAHLVKHANAVLRKLVDLSPEDPCARHNLAVSYFKMKDYERGILHCRKALKLNPEYTLALYNLALAHSKLGQRSRAKRYISMALTLEPQDENLQELSKRLGMAGMWTKVLRAFGIGKVKLQKS